MEATLSSPSGEFYTADLAGPWAKHFCEHMTVALIVESARAIPPPAKIARAALERAFPNILRRPKR